MPSFRKGVLMNNRIMLVGVIALVFCVSLRAQSSQDRKAWGYAGGAVGVTAGDGSSLGFFHVLAGGEGLMAGGLGAAVDVGYIAPFEEVSAGFGALSPGISYHFGRNKKADPFVTGGYTLFFRSGTANGYHFGGGVDWWAKERMGIRFEGRDMVIEGEEHLISFRVNLLFK